MSTIRVFKHYVRVPFLLLAGVEALIFMTSVYAAAHLRFLGDIGEIQQSIGPLFPRAVIFMAVMMVSMIAMGLYQARLREGLPGILLRTSVSFLVGGSILSLLFYLIPGLYIGRGALALAGVISFFVVGTLRPIFFHSVDERLLKRKVLILGAGERASIIDARMRRRSDRRGFDLVGYAHIDGQPDLVNEKEIVHLQQSLLDYAIVNKLDEVVVAVDDRRKAFPLDELLDCKMAGVDVVDLLTFFEREAGKVQLNILHPSWLLFSDGFQQNVVRDTTKRLFDLCASFSLLAVTWPVMLLTALLIKIEDGWSMPVFYRQTRTGLNGAGFDVLKFRSMIVDAEKSGAQWATKNDARVTRVGAIIRKLRIDELPQILNVWNGSMSFVGPRPERPEFIERLSEVIPYYQERHRVKPGITGWAQLSYPYGATEKDSLEKQQFDLYYVKNHSLFFDVLILMQTVEVVLFGKGAR
ncbi:MAG: TIGR03013 family PEP-CTERM/XrtA system glycosyltransferase [Gammaproteobacteria bacterium]|nr:TIGR03013 family PEP-CTERM/XrtA system glycosyltransferase [Gammaproteobacteria bacterium]